MPCSYASFISGGSSAKWGRSGTASLRREALQHVIRQQKQDQAERKAREAAERQKVRKMHPVLTWTSSLEVHAAEANTEAKMIVHRRHSAKQQDVTPKRSMAVECSRSQQNRREGTER
jgi:hypothetical protein